MDINDILDNGTEEEINALLESDDFDVDLFDSEDGEKETPVVTDEKETTPANSEQDKTDVQADSSTDASDKQEVPAGFVEIDGKFFVEATDVSSKDGKHSLPYDVLVQARERAKQAEEAAQRADQEKADLKAQLAETKRAAELHSEQLKEAGIDPRKLPEEMLKDPELMDRIKEEYPELGELVSVLASKIDKFNGAKPDTTTKQEDTKPGEDEFQTAFDSSQHLKAWRKSDPDKWAMAADIDNQLANDLSFRNKPIAERFAEVEKRVNTAFGAEHQQKPTNASLGDAIPNSPTDLGVQASDKNASASFLDKDAATITAEMEGMTEAQIEELLVDVSELI